MEARVRLGVPSRATRAAHGTRDAGFFGPGSLGWRIDREVMVLAGATAAFLLQLADPAVAAGVAQHSNFREDPYGRLRRTLVSTFSVAFGTTRRAEAAIGHLNAIHRSVSGTVAESGDPYQALDPVLLLWVHATLIDTALRIYDRYVEPLSVEEMDAYLRESRPVATRLGVPDELPVPGVACKEAVFPFTKLPGVDTVLGPEMRSTGEVMGIAESFGMAFAKAQIAADGSLPLSGTVFVTVNDSDKPTVVPIVRRFHELGFRILATEGTQRYLRARGVPAERVLKVYEGRPNAIDLIVSGDVHLLINTPLGKFTQQDDYAIRRAALVRRVPYTTTMSAASAACDAIIALRSRTGSVRSLQEWHGKTTVGKLEPAVASPETASRDARPVRA